MLKAQANNGVKNSTIRVLSRIHVHNLHTSVFLQIRTRE